jgi:hypothetical protein
MHGAPGILLLPAKVLYSLDLLDNAKIATNFAGVQLSSAEGRFRRATAASSEYERQIAYRAGMPLVAVLMAAPEFSCLGCLSALAVFDSQWGHVPLISNKFLDQMDEAYDPPGAWRQKTDLSGS